METIPCDTETALRLYDTLLMTERRMFVWQRTQDACVTLMKDGAELRIAAEPAGRYGMYIDGKRVVDIPVAQGVEKLFANWCDRVYKTT